MFTQICTYIIGLVKLAFGKLKYFMYIKQRKMKRYFQQYIVSRNAQVSSIDFYGFIAKKEPVFHNDKNRPPSVYLPNWGRRLCPDRQAHSFQQKPASRLDSTRRRSLVVYMQNEKKKIHKLLLY
jgi:hypothetical protein